MKNSNFLDRRFNPAGMLRRGFLGLVIGIVLGGIGVAIFGQDAGSDTAPLVAFFIIVIGCGLAGAIWGSFEEPRQYDKGMQTYLGIMSWLSVGRPDILFSESTTIRQALWRVALTINMLLIVFLAFSVGYLFSNQPEQWLVYGAGILGLAGAIALSFVKKLWIQNVVLVMVIAAFIVVIRKI